jgi:hypothetical protein
MRKQKLLGYRRRQVEDLLVKGASQSDISTVLRISQPTVSRDVDFLESAAREQLKEHIQKRIPHTHLICMRGIDSVIKHAWIIISNGKNDYVKIHALNVLMAAYAHKQALTTDSSVVNESLNLIEKSKEKLEELEGDQERHEETDELAFTNISGTSGKTTITTTGNKTAITTSPAVPAPATSPANYNRTGFTNLYVLTINGKNFPIKYSITAGKLVGILADKDRTTLALVLNPSGNGGNFTTELPRNVIDSKGASNADTKFLIKIDGKGVDYKEVANNVNARILTIDFSKDNRFIEIIGTQMTS